MKVPSIVKGLLLTGAVTTLIWTGSDTIQQAKEFITEADTKVSMAHTGINLLKGDITSKKSRIAELKAEIEQLKEQLKINGDTSEELAQVREQLTQAQAEVTRLTQEVAEATTEKNRLTEQLTKANNEAKELQDVLNETTSAELEIPTIMQIEEFITENGEVSYNPDLEKIKWGTSANPQYMELEENFITTHSEAIKSMLTDEEISVKGMTITVNVTSTQGSTNYIKLLVKGASPEAKAILTKSKINNKISDSKNYIDNVTFN